MVQKNKYIFGAALFFSIICALGIYVISHSLKKNTNVIFIVIDTLRADHLGTYGCTTMTSPSIDAFAKQSLVFEHAYATAPWTSPSVASMITGRYPRELGITTRSEVINAQETTLAEILRDSGYSTHGVISHFFIGSKLGYAQGFESYNEEESGKGRDYVSSPGVSREAIKRIQLKSKKPLFFFAQYFDPHYNYQMHPILNTFPNYAGRLLGGKIKIEELRNLALNNNLTSDELRYITACYDSEIRFTDQQIGLFFDELKRNDLYDDALIILTADHGEELGGKRHNWIGHTKWLSEDLIKIPLLIKLPNQKESQRIHIPISLVDLLPSILQYLGLPIPDHISGVPFSLSDENISARPIFAETRRMNNLDMVIVDNWKLVYDLGSDKQKLYNLATDPEALTDLAADQKGILVKMEKMRRDWNSRVASRQSTSLDSKKRPSVFSKDEHKKLKELGYVQ